eukprot:COSAG05_NODE_1979_length_3756_cov_7.971561_4_plen_384_part_00
MAGMAGIGGRMLRRSARRSVGWNFISRSISTSVPLHPADLAFSRSGSSTELASAEAEAAGQRLCATASSFETGVAAVQLSNGDVTATLLPFQGQQVWDFTVHPGGGEPRSLTMVSNQRAPIAVNPAEPWGLINSYGAFFVHCGGNSLGIPGPEDDHPLHGELPNAQYHKARVVTGEDARGAFIGLEGVHEYTRFCSQHWSAAPSVRLYAGETALCISMTITNNFHAPMDLMYMGHGNFRPVVDSQLLYTHECTAEAISVSGSVNGLVPPTPEYEAYLEELKADPSIHNSLSPELLERYNPEVIFFLHKYQADREGWAHTLQKHSGGESGDFIKHKPAQLDKAARFPSCTVHCHCSLATHLIFSPWPHTAKNWTANHSHSNGGV